MDEEESFLRDIYTGVKKVVEAGQYLCNLVEFQMGRYANRKYQEKEQEIIVEKDQPKENQLLIESKKVKKKVNSIKPKGDIELKNIQYRISDRRYIGRKQIHGKTITVYAQTQKDCAEKLKNKINEIVKIDVITKRDNTNLFKDKFMQWFRQEKEEFITEKTKKDIMLVYKETEPLHNLSIKKINKQMLFEFFARFQNGRSKEKLHLYLNACLKYYYNEGLISVNPCANVKILKTQTRKPSFTYEQQSAILEALEGTPLKVIILIYLITGLRKTELNFRSIEDHIDFDNNVLKAVNLKGRNFVKRYKEIQLSKDGLLLIMNNLDIIHSYNAEKAYKEFSKLLKNLKIEGSIVNCRHTFATNCFYLGKKDVTISREMGHTRTQITKDIYTDIDYHLSKEKIHKLYNNLYNEN